MPDPTTAPILTRSRGYIARVVAAIASAALTAGPIFTLLFIPFAWVADLDEVRTLGVQSTGAMLVKSVVDGSIPGLMMLTLHALAVGLLARWRKDSIWVSMAVGSAIGLLPAAFYVLLSLQVAADDPHLAEPSWFLPMMVTLFVATGTIVAALYWRIAIRPRHKQRLAALRDARAIQAME